ncbi:MAG: BPSS1780 family membrane protein [Pseudomonadota bacterium]|nr:BPSS1780 family membrane protein [Pseudomonadota bacterium]
MKLHIVPARTGAQWVREGIRLFFKQPLAFASLLLSFILATSVLSLLPMVGDALALALVPAGTVGLMAAGREAGAGRFPMPALLIVALRQSPAQTRAMLLLGALYAAAVLAIMALGTYLGGDQMMKLIEQNNGRLTPELMADPAMQQAVRAAMRQMLLGSLLYLPVSVLFWHAPALVHWHGVPPAKALFFSAVGVLRNTGAYLIYGMGWLTVAMLGWMLLLMLAALLGNTRVAINGVFPVSLTVATMLAASLWATFRDCFDTRSAPPASDLHDSRPA